MGFSKKRKQTFVDKDVQGALIRRISFHWMIFFLVTATAFVLLRSLLGDPGVPFLTKVEQATSEFSLLGILILALLPAFVLDSIRFSNRFVGPIVRLRRVLRELHQNGDTETVVFRENDFWGVIGSDFNKCTELVRSQRERIRQLEDQIALKESVAN